MFVRPTGTNLLLIVEVRCQHCLCLTEAHGSWRLQSAAHALKDDLQMELSAKIMGAAGRIVTWLKNPGNEVCIMV